MMNPVVAFEKALIIPEVNFNWVKKAKTVVIQKVKAVVDSEPFWMVASVTLLLTIDWATQHALLRLAELS